MTDIKLVCFDLNKTLIEENTWLKLNLAMGVTKEEDEMLLRQYETGVISYLEWQRTLLKIYKKRGDLSLENITENILNYRVMYENGH